MIIQTYFPARHFLADSRIVLIIFVKSEQDQEMKMDLTAIWVTDPERERAFFIRYFNCIANEKYTNRAKGFSSYFIPFPEGRRIETMKREDIKGGEKKDSPGYDHIAINTGIREKVDSLTGLMRREGVIIESGPRDTGDGYVVNEIMDACYRSAISKKWEPVKLSVWRGKEKTARISGMKDFDKNNIFVKEETMPDGKVKIILKNKKTGKITQKVKK